jgi:DNA-binding response OmpR family regulator
VPELPKGGQGAAAADADGQAQFVIGMIEDDAQLASILARQLGRFEFAPHMVDCYGDIVEEIRQLQPHAILLDVNLPQYDGFYWCRLIRRVTRAPIIFVSARNAGMDQVFALENGGDDYVIKPFDVDVLVAKLRAQIRRAYGAYAVETATVTPTDSSIACGALRLNTRRMEIAFAHQVSVLTKTETELMRQLMEAAGDVVSRDTLLGALWDDTDFVDDNTLTVNVTRLRRKLASLGLDDIIRTVRGVGYQLSLAERAD